MLGEKAIPLREYASASSAQVTPSPKFRRSSTSAVQAKKENTAGLPSRTLCLCGLIVDIVSLFCYIGLMWIRE